jgi:ribosomal protein S18 acetylase RimI-like enzyme
VTSNQPGQGISLRLSLVGLFRAYAEWQTGGDVLETDNVLFYSNSKPFSHPFFSFAVRLNPFLNAEKFVCEAGRWFASKNKQHVVIVTTDGADEDLRRLLFSDGAQQIGISERMKFTGHASAPGLGGSKLDLGNFDDFIAICSAAFGYEHTCVDALFQDKRSVLATAVSGRIFYQDEAPAGAGIAIQTGSVVTLDWIGTHPLYRGEGLAFHCVRQLCSDVHARGGGLIVLSATQAGKRVYEKAGFTSCGGVRLHRYPTDMNS